MTGRIVLIRHGQTEWSASGQHTSVTDIDLTAQGEHQATVLPRMLAGLELDIETTFCSPRLRARRTAELAGLTISETLPELAEWFYGEYEGLTSEQIHAERPGWSIFSDGAPGGETPDEVSGRADRVLARAKEASATGDVALVCHGHFSRSLAVRWVELPIEAGVNISMNPAAITVCGQAKGRPILDHVNVVPFTAWVPVEPDAA